ncbi:DUF6711 family protein [Paenibacillus elgii]|uniref:DUF6711 family protein n=1 Tax=Paenibacillus elgii TaxID=189691 RepID=UPI000248E09B|nr:DUF6711 family protein [Paenibacillus elgii]
MAAIIKVGNVELPSPSDMQIAIQDIKKAERNAKGNLISELITTKRKIELSWSFLTATQLQTLLTAVAPNTFSVTYLDPLTNASRTGTFYAGDRKVGVIDFRAGVPRYKEIKFNLIEV